jgi:hypothetical protein
MKSKSQFALIILAIPVILIGKVLKGVMTFLTDNLEFIQLFLLSVFSLFILFIIYSEFYFRSKSFLQVKSKIINHTKNANDLNRYIEHLKSSWVNIESKNYGLSNLSDKSAYNFRRKDWSKLAQNNKTHHCSLSVCKNASNQPIKYLCKYFNIEKNESTLFKFEKVLHDFTSVEEGKILLNKEKEKIINNISYLIPSLIKAFNGKKLIRKLGFEDVDISDDYIPIYVFQYVSAGGNSSLQTDIKLDLNNLNLLVNYLNDLIKWRKSIAGQRALMTTKLRSQIKNRDGFKCCNCGIGISDEPNLLLEIDHIIPLSKGGMTSIDNLQTLCWKCNRTKGSKVYS